MRSCRWLARESLWISGTCLARPWWDVASAFIGRDRCRQSPCCDMGWQTLSASLRRWDSGQPSGELEAAVEEVLASSDDEEALKIFTEALNPSLQRGTDFLQRLAKTEGAKCRCDAVWYGDTIAYGCKTCGLSSASCICVFCFDAGDHEGHDFYISRSDYGCCDCGDAYAWRKSGFCRHHPGPRKEVDPAQLLPEATRRRAQLLIPAQVKRLVRFQSSAVPATQADAWLGHATGSTKDPDETSAGTPAERNADSSGGPVTGVRSTGGSAQQPSALEHGPGCALPSQEPRRVLVTGVNLRVSEEQLREFFSGRVVASGAAAGAGDVVKAVALQLVRDPETKASKGRAYLTLRDEAVVEATLKADGEVLRGSPLHIHAGEQAIAAAEKHLQAWEAHFEWLLNLGGFHDGLRKIIGQVFLDPALLGEQSAVEMLLRHSHLMEPSVRKLETNLMVDLMLDLDFKHCFAQVFTRLYRELVLARAGNQDTNELGDFTCQIFTRQDVTLELVREHSLVRNLLSCLWDLLQPALAQGAVPAVFNHESNIFRDHEIIQCSMDLLYVLDHAEVAREIVRSPQLRSELWQGWVRILIAMQAMNPHERRSGAHVEFTNPAWGNALTLHTDLMSNTWLILDAIESKAELEAVQDMARWTWTKLRAWMLEVHFAENRAAGAVSLEDVIDYEVSKRTVSFHLPVNRVLALLLHHLCVRSGRESGCGGSLPSVHATFAAVGLTEEADVLWWMEHPLRALVLHSQVSAGMWRRNGEALENESEFYRMNYWHHLLIDMDLLILRMAAMILRPETFFRSTLTRFELGLWLQPGDPLASLLPGASPEDDFALQKLQSFVLLLYQLLSPHTPLALAFKQLVLHTTRQYLSIGPRSHSQLWDPRLERSTATATAKDQQMLESALREISTFSQADGSGHSSAKYHLKDEQWVAVDPYFHLFSWSEQQKSEENLLAALKARNETVMQWLSGSAQLQPAPFEVYRASFHSFCSCTFVQAVCWLLLAKLAFRHLKDNGSVADGRLLVFTLHLALRSARTSHETTALSELVEDARQVVAVPLREEDVQLFTVAMAMGPHLCTSARRKFRVNTATFFDRQLYAENPAVPAETDLTLLDVVERLCTAPEGCSSGGLARGLRTRLLQDPENASALESQPRPWFAPPAPSACEAGSTPGRAGSAGELGGSSPDGEGRGSLQDEARRAKRRRAAQERQQRMLDDLRKRQTAFITGAQGQRMLEEAAAKGASPSAGAGSGPVGEGSTAAECVICISQQEGEDGQNPLGLLCFLRPAVASCLPRPCVPTASAVLLQAPKLPVAERQSARGPQCFSPRAPDGLVLARACSHRMHFVCWRRFRPAALASSGGRLTCPYCGTVANALLPAAPVAPGGLPHLAVAAASAPAEGGGGGAVAVPPPPWPEGRAATGLGHADASADFADQVALQMRKLGDAHVLPAPLAEALSITTDQTPLLSLAKLAADNIALAEARLRTRQVASASSSGGSCSSTAPAVVRNRPAENVVAMSTAVLRFVIAEALEGAPRALAEETAALATGNALEAVLAPLVNGVTPHSRFQILAALLLCLCTDGTRGASGAATHTARHLLRGFYLVEVAVVLGTLASDALIDSELRRTQAAGAAHAAELWQRIRRRAGPAGPPVSGSLTPLESLSEAAAVLRLALNPFLTKVHVLLSLLCPGHEPPFEAMGAGLSPADEHRLLARPDLGLSDVEDLLLAGGCSEPPASAAAAEGDAWASCSRLAVGLLDGWLGQAPGFQPGRGLQPPSPLLLVHVADGATGVDDPEHPRHVWQVSSEVFDRMVAGNSLEVAELSAPPGFGGRLFCVAYRLMLPVITERVYQKFYTQFVHARCTVCRSSPPIPTLCLLCGAFLCCNSECCRHPDGESGTTLGEVTQHAQTCGFGTCIFLQLSNSLVHIVADGFIACWGSLYLDCHGEEEYNLARPLHISEARLQQLTQSIREVSFDFESRLKWKKVIFV